MLKFGKKKLIAVSLVLSMSLGHNDNSEAIVPMADVANLAENIAGNIQDMQTWAKEKALMMMEMDMEAMMEEMSVDNTNNAMSNMIIRTGAATEEVQNLEVAEMTEPDKDACNTIAVQASLNDALCIAADKVRDKTEETLEKNADFTAIPSEQIQKQKEIASEFVEKCLELQDKTVDEENPMATSMCLRASILTGGSTIDTYDAQQSEAVSQYIQLITGPIPSTKKTGTLEKDSNSRNMTLIGEMRKEAFRSMVSTSLHEIASLRTSPGGVEMSPLHNMTRFNKDRFGKIDWMATIQNVNPDKKNDVLPSEIMRKMAVMDSFMVHLSLMQYKQQLRIEALQAASLSLASNPL